MLAYSPSVSHRQPDEFDPLPSVTGQSSITAERSNRDYAVISDVMLVATYRFA
jgi:hypothetical protein